MSDCLQDLYFGKDDAETDITRGGLLKHGFLQTEAYESALSGKKTLIIGRKGSGKSAICLMLHNVLSKEDRSSIVSPDEISAEEIRRFQLLGIRPAQAKQLLWRYVFVVQIAKFILVQSKKIENSETLAEVKAIRQFLIDNKEVDDLNFIERFWKAIELLKGSLSVEAFGAKVNASIEYPNTGIRADVQLTEVENYLYSAIEKLNLSKNLSTFHLLVDQIEKVWSNDPDSDQMVVGLLLASKHINAKFGNFLICTIFLRTDIYEKLQFQDRDKFRGDEFRLEWDSQQLLDLILARAKASYSSVLSVKALWGDIFPRNFDEQDTSSYLLSRTLYRPRDIIQLCNLCRDTAKRNRHERIIFTDIKKSFVLYSSWKLTDLQNEWFVNYPFLADIFVLLTNRSYYLKRSQFQELLELLSEDFEKRYPDLGSIFSPHILLSILYSIGLIGIKRNNEANYYYQDNDEGGVRQNDEEFIIHPCFRQALQCASALDINSFVSTMENGDPVTRLAMTDVAQFGGDFLQIRGSRPRKVLRRVRYDLELLSKELRNSILPSDISEEIRTNFSLMKSEIDLAESANDSFLEVEVANRIYQHLSRMRNCLLEKNLLKERSGLLYSWMNVIENLESFQRKGYYDDDLFTAT